MDTGVVAILAALLGGCVTLTVTYLNNKSKNFELEYNYRKKQEENYLNNAQKHTDDIYIPLFSKITTFQNKWTDIKGLQNHKALEDEINKLKTFRNELEEKGSIAYLTNKVEDDFNQLLNFVSKSLEKKQIRYGVIIKYKLLGQDYRQYKVVPEKYNSHSISFYMLFFQIYEFITKNFLFFIFKGLIEYDVKFVLDSADPTSEDFNEQLLDFICSLKNDIKSITLGTKE